MTLKEAKREAKKWAIRKWEFIVENEGYCDYDTMIAKYPKLEEFTFYCSYCNKYWLNNCLDCPLRIKSGNKFIVCNDEEHPHDIWCRNKSKINAQRVLDLIKNT